MSNDSKGVAVSYDTTADSTVVESLEAPKRKQPEEESADDPPSSKRKRIVADVVSEPVCVANTLSAPNVSALVTVTSVDVKESCNVESTIITATTAAAPMAAAATTAATSVAAAATTAAASMAAAAPSAIASTTAPIEAAMPVGTVVSTVVHTVASKTASSVETVSSTPSSDVKDVKSDSSKVHSKCPEPGCDFFKGKSGFCSVHAPVQARVAILKSAAERQRAADQQLKQYQQRQAMSLYDARFQSYVMSDADFSMLRAKVTKGITPKQLLNHLVTEKWLLTSKQAYELIDACLVGYKLLEITVSAAAAGEAESRKRSDAYQNVICSRVYDRWTLQTRGYEGYYLRDVCDPWYSETTRLDAFQLFAAHSAPVW